MGVSAVPEGGRSLNSTGSSQSCTAKLFTVGLEESSHYLQFTPYSTAVMLQYIYRCTFGVVCDTNGYLDHLSCPHCRYIHIRGFQPHAAFIHLLLASQMKGELRLSVLEELLETTHVRLDDD